MQRQKAHLEGAHLMMFSKRKKQKVAPVLKFHALRPKYDDLLSDPTTEAQTVGHTRVAAAYKAKVCLGGIDSCIQLTQLNLWSV